MELKEILEKIKPFIVDGEIRQLSKDSGDSAQRDATFWAIVGMLYHDYHDWDALPEDDIWQDLGITKEQSIANHEIAPGYYRRTNNIQHWGYAGNNFSRDQHSVLRLAFAVMGDRKRLRESAWAMIRRLGFHQNYRHNAGKPGLKVPDICHPNEVAVTIRGLSLWFLRPLLYLTDVFFLGDLYFRTKTPWDYDNQLLQNLAYAQLKYPTFISRYAWLKYDKQDALAKIKNYHNVETENGISGFYELFELLAQKIK
jgi:hypothetical protein